MDTDQITTGLLSLYGPNARIVFWRDPDGEFAETLSDLNLGEISIINTAEVPALEAKAVIELERPDDSFLIYETGDKPDPDIDWLLDIRLYAASFAADRATMILKELGLHSQSLRDHIAARSKFFANKERIARAGKLIQPEDDARAIDLKIMAGILRLDQADYFSIVRALYHDIPGRDPTVAPPAWDDFAKYDVAGSFWRFAEDHFGYTEDEPSLENLLIRSLVTDLAHDWRGDLPNALQHLRLPKEGAANAVVCISQWRDSASYHDSYDSLSSTVAETLKLSGYLTKIEADSLKDAKTFLQVEKHIAGQLRDRVIDTAGAINVEAIREIAARRQDGYWANDKLPTSAAAPRSALSCVYDALVAASELFSLRSRYDSGFSYPSPKAFFDAYTGELYRFDQVYRHFCEAADIAEAEGWDILKELRARVEDCYGNWYVAQLATAWGDYVESSLLSDWRVEEVPSQQDFFLRQVKPTLEKGDDRRAFVIISDAFRYEAAQELTGQLNGKYRFKAKLDAMLGVLPSYTGLGMAALLPHKELAYADNSLVHVDGKSSSGTANRGKILEAVGGVAILADELMDMKKDDARSFIKPYRVIYVYHDQIDKTADTGNEGKTFAAVRTTIDELDSLISKIVNSLNGNDISITADHGFLFQESPPTEVDKNVIADKPAGTRVSKKRYLLGTGLPDNAKAYRGTTAATAGTVDKMEFWVPKGTNRFNFVGGSRFIHGGAMLQEIVVPVIKVHQVKGASAEKTKTKQVGVSILGGPLKVTTNRHKFRLIQTEVLSDRVKLLTVTIAIFDGNDRVSSSETVTFDSRSSDVNDRTKGIWLTLAGSTFDKKKNYQLILRNTDTGVEETRMDVTIDLAFENDF